MTEAEWLTSDLVGDLMGYLKGKASDRKLRLFGCACCRKVWHLLKDERDRTAIEVCERFADGLADKSALSSAHQSAIDAANEAEFKLTLVEDEDAPLECAALDVVSMIAEEDDAHYVVDLAADTLRSHLFTSRWREVEQVQLKLLHDIFGNPFREVIVDPAWRTPAVSGLALSIYDEHSYEHLPILADALEEAGCTNADILNHCRQPGEHVRGCWVLDLILGK
jgi:hypothetical protein